jgi:Cu-processing system permease protein
MRVGTIAKFTCREAVRRRMLAVAVALGVLFLGMNALGLWMLSKDATVRGLSNNLVWRSQATATLTAMGLYAVDWLLVLMTVLMAVDTLSGEVASGAMQLVLAKPVRRWEIVAGKWIGFAVLALTYLLFMAGGVLAESWLLLGRRPVHLPQTLGLMALESLLLLSITLCAGTSLSTMATGACVFGMHILAFLGGWIEEFGTISQSVTATNLGVAISLAVPTEALWRRAAFEIRGPVLTTFGRTAFDVGSVPSGWMVVYAALYLAVGLYVAVLRFNARDL